MAQLASAALTTDEHELRASSDPVHARLIQLVTCTRVCKAWQRQAATCLADQRFWEQLCTNRWHDAVPPTLDYRAHYVKQRALEKHTATPDWRDQFHLLLDVRWNNLEQSGRTQTTASSSCVRSPCATPSSKRAMVSRAMLRGTSLASTSTLA